MKNFPFVILLLIMICSVGMTCNDNTEPDDQILYQDIDPDTNMVYDIIVLNPDPYECEGTFSYLADLDQDGTDDFQISGHTWPGHFDHVGVMWYNDHETKVTALHEHAFVGLEMGYEMCCETDLVLGDRINDKFVWAREARLSYSVMDNLLDCYWKGDYLAVKLIKEGHNIFGWIDIDGYENPTIKEMAVNLTYDQKILAGQKE